MEEEYYERQQKENAEFAASEGADYYDPDSPVIWKRYIVGPVPRWRRMLWSLFPPSHAKMRQIMRQRREKMWRDAGLTGSRRPTGKDWTRVFSLGLGLPVAFSLVGPIYYGYTHGPYWRVIVWASVCTVIFCWQRDRHSGTHSAPRRIRSSGASCSCWRLLSWRLSASLLAIHSSICLHVRCTEPWRGPAVAQIASLAGRVPRQSYPDRRRFSKTTSG